MRALLLQDPDLEAAAEEMMHAMEGFIDEPEGETVEGEMSSNFE